MPRCLDVFYSDVSELPLPADHRFPIRRYRLLRERLESSDFRSQLRFRLPDLATDEQLHAVHSSEYVERITRGELTPLEQRRIGFPWSPQLVQRSRRSVGATIAAARAAIKSRASVHLAGGTHHAFHDRGQGFCVFNDVAVAVRHCQARDNVRRFVIVDLDVHQGNGTAAIFQNDQNVFTFSIHGDRNYPFVKCPSDLDLAIEPGTGDDEYLAVLDDVLQNRIPFDRADMVFYLAGADPFVEDRLGTLDLTKHGLARRDQMVMEECRRHGLPLAVVMAGGYPRKLEDVVEINVRTVQEVLKLLN